MFHEVSATILRESTAMEPSSRDCLRRAVRRAVHHACWRRLEGDHAKIHADAGPDIAAARTEFAEATVTDDDVRQWIADDEADFDRAILISDLVARRVARTAEPAPALERVAKPAAAARQATPEIALPRPVRTAPSITALLDDMFAQRSAPATP